MATASPAKTTTPAAPAKGAAPAVDVSLPSRREFLYYIWGASIVLLLGQATAGIVWFALPRFKEGTFGGVFKFDPTRIPETPGAAPISEPIGRFWVSHTDEGVLALYAVCTHLGCLPKWVDTNGRFECPCHGSKYRLDGSWIEGPAPRGMDRFSTTLVFSDGSTASTNEAGAAIPLNGRTTADIVEVQINTGNRILLPPHA
ncbi:MAG: ubiquinol-cytochrome c reductase iron-sulfur subunit [Chloroflexi bacterium]|nr:ubiquinol-cytochrome c reductase iron-sulfur subunit [Chloroflexota bacterium]